VTRKTVRALLGEHRPEQKAAGRLLGIHAFVAKASAGTQLVPTVKRLIASD